MFSAPVGSICVRKQKKSAMTVYQACVQVSVNKPVGEATAALQKCDTYIGFLQCLRLFG